MKMKNTVVLGASVNPNRYSNLAVRKLKRYGHPVVPIGIRKGTIDDLSIIIGQPELKEVDTVTLYLNSQRQKEYYDFILRIKPARIIFNPGAENPELKALAEQNGIETEEACTLVMLSIGQY